MVNNDTIHYDGDDDQWSLDDWRIDLIIQLSVYDLQNCEILQY